MSLLTDRDEIRHLLRRDPVWAVYALGDTGPELWPKTTWHRSGGEIALVLRAYSEPILWASGSLEGLGDELGGEPRYSVQVPPTSLAVLGELYDISSLKRMWRMTVAAGEFRPVDCGEARRLGAADVAALKELYADGALAGEAPEFFFGPMVTGGVFFGCEQDGRLTAVAGTHLVELDEKVAAIGNVYVRRDSRRRGLAGLVTSAVVQELVRLGVEVIALNAYQANGAAIRVYERLGFRRHCEFVEGMIERRG